MPLLLTGAGKGRTSGVAAWVPTDEASLIAWYDLSTPASYDNPSKTWTSRFSTGGTRTLVATGTGPTKVTNGMSGANKDTLQFAGTSDTQLIMATPGFTSVITVLVMRGKTTGVGVNPTVWNRTTSGAGAASLIFIENGGLQAKYASAGANSADSFTESLNADYLLLSLHSLAARTIRENGAQISTNATLNSGTEPTSTEGFGLGIWTGSSLSWTSEVAVMAMFTTAGWTTTILEKIEGYIAWQGLGVSTTILPGGHTYKSVAP